MLSYVGQLIVFSLSTTEQGNLSQDCGVRVSANESSDSENLLHTGRLFEHQLELRVAHGRPVLIHVMSRRNALICQRH